jgi:hypothetical protein
MAKNLFQDMARINHERRKAVDISVREKSEIRKVEVRLNFPQNRHTLWLVAIIAVIFFLFSLSYLFSKAEVVINPKIEEVVLNESLSASLDNNGDNLSFDLVVISGEETKTIMASEEKEISQRAKGTVLIYNTFNSTPQALSIDTRLEGSNGKLYKTETKTVVPGMSGGVPGSVEVKIYAAEVGAEYNSDPIDFKIFGFKGTTKYDKFYARSKGEIIGGFQGRSHVVSGIDKENGLNELQVLLREKLFKNATDQIPDGFILFKDAIFLELEDISGTEFLSPNDTLLIKQKGTLYGILLKEDQLTKKLAKNNILKYDDSPVFIPNIKDLIFSLSGSNVLFKDIKNVSFHLSGPVKIVWKFDIEKLRVDLLGKSKKDFKLILSQYPNINSADLSLSPIWKRSIPDEVEDIKIILNYPEGI